MWAQILCREREIRSSNIDDGRVVDSVVVVSRESSLVGENSVVASSIESSAGNESGWAELSEKGEDKEEVHFLEFEIEIVFII